MIRAVLFDFDGVICQTETYKLDLMTDYLEKLGLRVDPRRLYRLAGGTSMEKEAMLDEIFADQARYRQVKECIMTFHPSPFLFREIRTDGIEETLQNLKQRKLLLGVASNSRQDRLKEALEECQLLSYFDCVTGAFDAGRRKPDPWVYLHVMEQLGVCPQECLIVEDSALGIRAGKASGSRVIALKDRDDVIDQSEADIRIERISQVLEYLVE